MRTVLLRIKARVEKANGDEVFPVALEVDDAGLAETIRVRQIALDDEIPVTSVLARRDTVEDPGMFAGRQLGDDTALAGGGGTSANEEIAAWLHGLVFGGKLNPAWQILEAGSPDRLRLVVDVEPAELRRQRWELMGVRPFYLGRHPMCSIVRGRYDTGRSVDLLDGPLRVLVIVGSQRNDPRVQAKQEIAALVRRLACRRDEVELRVLIRPTRDPRPQRNALQPARKYMKLEALYFDFKPHVLHFIGHGRIDPTNGEPYLYLHDERANRDIEWREADIIADLGRHQPAFVFLNACHTVDTALGPAEALQEGRADSATAWSMSETFLRALRVRAVLGMHGAVRGDAAGFLAAALYEQILAGDDIDLALTQARIAVDQHRGNDRQRAWDWALPYLRVAVPPDQVLGLARPVPQLDNAPALFSRFQDRRLFVNRIADRSQFLDRVQWDPGRSSNLVLIKGEGHVGKTSLTASCVEWAARRGRPVKYVRLADGKADPLGILRQICAGGRNVCLIDKPFPRGSVARFYQTLNAALAGANTAIEAEVDTFPIVPQWLDASGNPRILPPNSQASDPMGDLFRAFLGALEKVPDAARKELARTLEPRDPIAARRVQGDRRPFLVVIDQVSRETVDENRFQNEVVPHFLTPLATATGIDANLCVVLCVKSTDSDELGLGPFSDPGVCLNLKPFQAGEFRSLAKQFFDKFVSLPEYQAGRFDRRRWLNQIQELGRNYEQGRELWKPDLFYLLMRITFDPQGSIL